MERFQNESSYQGKRIEEPFENRKLESDSPPTLNVLESKQFEAPEESQAKSCMPTDTLILFQREIRAVVPGDLRVQAGSRKRIAEFEKKLAKKR